MRRREIQREEARLLDALQKEENNIKETEKQIEELELMVKNPETVRKDEAENKEQAEKKDDDKEKVEELVIDPDDDNLTSVSQLKPTSTQISKMTGATYISILKKQLEEECQARQNLEKELEDLKKISIEIASHLSEINKEHEKAMSNAASTPGQS